MLEKLKILNLSHSHRLRQTPDFSNMPNLESLKLKDCERLSSVHKSIGGLKCLILLNLKGCINISKLPESIYNLKSLKTFILFGCKKIDKLEDRINQMESLKTLEANETAITQVPFSLVRSTSITYVSICGHEGLPKDVFPILVRSWVSPRHSARSLQHVFASMPFLLPQLLRGPMNLWSKILRSRPYTFHIYKSKSLPSTVEAAEATHFSSSTSNALSKSNSQVCACILSLSNYHYHCMNLSIFSIKFISLAFCLSPLPLSLIQIKMIFLRD